MRSQMTAVEAPSGVHKLYTYSVLAHTASETSSAAGAGALEHPVPFKTFPAPNRSFEPMGTTLAAMENPFALGALVEKQGRAAKAAWRAKLVVTDPALHVHWSDSERQGGIDTGEATTDPAAASKPGALPAAAIRRGASAAAGPEPGEAEPRDAAAAREPSGEIRPEVRACAVTVQPLLKTRRPGPVQQVPCAVRRWRDAGRRAERAEDRVVAKPPAAEWRREGERAAGAARGWWKQERMRSHRVRPRAIPRTPLVRG